jgi:hypothetical protein
MPDKVRHSAANGFRPKRVVKTARHHGQELPYRARRVSRRGWMAITTITGTS